MEIILFEPIYQERVWGGRGFESSLGRELPEGKVIGESWEIVDRPEAQSTVTAGTFKGMTIRALIEKNSKELMGPDYDRQKPFPILVKWLDCQDRLSLQVHPPKDVAPGLGGEPKTENWYIADCKEGAGLLVGLKNGATREAFVESLKDDSTNKLVQRIPVKIGDSMFVYSGRIHAIDAGNLIIEIQQNSDTTYRVYDWGRVGLDGKPRQLHVEESLKSIDFSDFEPPILHAEGKVQELANSEEFKLLRVNVAKDSPLEFASNEKPRILSVVSGSLVEKNSGTKLTKGTNAILPYEGAFSFEADGENEATVLVTEDFH